MGISTRECERFSVYVRVTAKRYNATVVRPLLMHSIVALYHLVCLRTGEGNATRHSRATRDITGRRHRLNRCVVARESLFNATRSRVGVPGSGFGTVCIPTRMPLDFQISDARNGPGRGYSVRKQICQFYVRLASHLLETIPNGR